MKIEKIKELVKILNNYDYKDVFASMIIFEEVSYLHDIEDLTKNDIDFLENLYYKFMKSEITGLINDDLKYMIHENSEEV